jgi:hypothetical protein
MLNMTLGDGHDKTFTCDCGHFLRDQVQPAYTHDWRCGKCKKRFEIFMDDGNENTYTVMRRHAQEVKVNDLVVYRENHGLAGSDIIASGQSGKKWFLNVRGYNAGTMPCDAYVNVEYIP